MSEGMLLVSTRAPHTTKNEWILDADLISQLAEKRLAQMELPEWLCEQFIPDNEAWDEDAQENSFIDWLRESISAEDFEKAMAQPFAFVEKLYEAQWAEVATAREKAAVQTALRDHFLFCLQELGQNDVVSMKQEGMPYWITGGPSWGDDPTDSFEYLRFIAEARVFDEAFEIPAAG